MRGFIDAHVFDDLSQGSKTYLKGLYSAVLSKDRKNDFFFASDTGSSVAIELGSAPNLHSIQYKSHNKFVRLAWDIPRLIKLHRTDWAHFQYISPLIKSCPEIVTIHDLLFLDYPKYFPLSYRKPRKLLFRRSAKRADCVMTVSAYSKDAIVRHFKIDPEKIIVTPNGILDFFWQEDQTGSPLSEKIGKNNFILYVSRFEPRKNHLGLLRSYLKLQLWRQNIQLVFVGGVGLPPHEFSQFYDSLNSDIKKCVVFLKEVSVADLKWLYRNCRLFVYPSFAEGFGIPPLEAIACGANVICSNTTAMSEFSFLGDRLFNPENSEELTEKIAHFLKNPLGGNPGAKRDWIRTQYSWNSSAAHFLSALKKIGF